jgi:hypothetical protein
MFICPPPVTFLAGVELRRRIVQVCEEIPPTFLLNATMGVSISCRQCLEQYGGSFEQLE